MSIKIKLPFTSAIYQCKAFRHFGRIGKWRDQNKKLNYKKLNFWRDPDPMFWYKELPPTYGLCNPRIRKILFKDLIGNVSDNDLYIFFVLGRECKLYGYPQLPIGYIKAKEIITLEEAYNRYPQYRISETHYLGNIIMDGNGVHSIYDRFKRNDKYPFYTNFNKPSNDHNFESVKKSNYIVGDWSTSKFLNVFMYKTNEELQNYYNEFICALNDIGISHVDEPLIVNDYINRGKFLNRDQTDVVLKWINSIN